MKKVLIISYFFPPCNLTAGQRAQGWANYLSEHGYYPTIITRRWDQEVKTPEDALLSSKDEVIHEKNDRYEVLYMPYKSSFRDKLYTRLSGSRFQKVSRAFTFFSLIAENYSLRAIPARNLYQKAKQWIGENRDVETVVITGTPFNQFSFGYHLKKKLGVKWIADYRDDWNTSDFVGTSGDGFLSRIVKKLSIRSEKKWVGSAEFFTTISPYYVEKISAFVDRPGHVLLNGYELEVPEGKVNADQFVLTYNGSLYATQPVEDILSVVRRLIVEDNAPIELHFPGAAYDPIQKKRIEDSAEGIMDRISVTNRIPKEEVLQLQANSDALLMISHSNMKGVPSSKLYEYLCFEKPIVQYPNDFDIVESTLNETGLGICSSSTDELYLAIKELIDQKFTGLEGKITPNKKAIQSYSRRMQTRVLAELLTKIENENV
ncbi:MAG: hypothetical protein P8P74_00400 [Crocinitomicaceae bacterium]|nr:hypothetical protein [Crocinitomicaceae bacterium]